MISCPTCEGEGLIVSEHPACRNPEFCRCHGHLCGYVQTECPDCRNGIKQCEVCGDEDAVVIMLDGYAACPKCLAAIAIEERGALTC